MFLSADLCSFVKKYCNPTCEAQESEKRDLKNTPEFWGSNSTTFATVHAVVVCLVFLPAGSFLTTFELYWARHLKKFCGFYFLMKTY